MSQFDELPEGWTEVRFGEAVTLKRGFDLPKRHRQPGSFPIYAANGPVGTHEEAKIKGPGVVTGRSGTIGKVHFVEGDFWPLNTALFVEDFHGNDPKFCAYLLRNTDLKKYSSSTAVPTLNRNIVHDSDIALPPLNEQRRIVEKIEALTARSRKAREALEAIPELLDQFRQSVLAAAFRGDLTADWREQNPDVEPAEALLERIRGDRRKRWEEAELEKMRAKGKEPKDDKWKEKYKDVETLDEDQLPELPSSWGWVAAEELTTPGKSIIYGIIKPGPDTPGGVPYVRVTEMKTGTIDIKTLRRCSKERADKFSRATLSGGDILISKDGTIGKVALVPPELEGGNITQHVVRLSPTAYVLGPFIAKMIESPFVQGWLTKETKGIGLTGVNVEDFRQMPIPVPPVLEQKEILKKLDELLCRIEQLEQLYKLLSADFQITDQSILAKAFRGELVPQDPNDEPAAVLLERIRAERINSKGKIQNSKRRKQK